MKFDIDDARLTAYVLGELDAAEHAEVEKLLGEDAEARAFVESMSGVADALGAELSNPETQKFSEDGLGELRKARIAKAATGSRSKRWLVMGTAGLAAAAAVAALAVFPDKEQNQKTASAGLQVESRSVGRVGYQGQPEENGLANGDVPRNAHANLDSNERRQLEALGYMGGEESDYFNRTPIRPVAPLDNDFMKVSAEPLSTFSIDVDTASYSQMRQSLRAGRMPAPSSVRVEELINYFDYNYPKPAQDEPFGVVTEVSDAPWNLKHKLVRIGIKARDVVQDRRPRANLVFLLDVSGSMSSEDKLPLLRRSLEMLLKKLDAEDRIAMVVYAGASGVALPSTSVGKPAKILAALRQLKPGGSTNGSAGIELAYTIAQENFVEGGVNRVILATDGDFNVGTTSRAALTTLIADKAKDDVFLTVLGFGSQNFSDGTMEQLADRGNGNYAFIDTLAEAKKVLVDQVQSTLVTVAKDVKLQIEFNPQRVSSYRLIGYENRVLANEDFNNDAKDAGEIGAGHAVTALYEIVPPGAAKVDGLRYQTTTTTATTTSSAAQSNELLTLKLRYKEPTGDVSMKKEIPVFDTDARFATSSIDFKFASSVAAFGMILRGSSHHNNVTLSQVLDWASEGRGTDKHEYRAEFLQLVKKAMALQR
tara:strand:+ start:49631 stop:51583 length:1953 start_codon:yes stop_codon:yes gene_type:complete